MPSAVPRYLVSDTAVATIPLRLREHINDVAVHPVPLAVPCPDVHRARFASGLPTVLLAFAKSDSVGDPMAGTGRLASETGRRLALNDINTAMRPFLEPLAGRGCEVTYGPATEIAWAREVCVFSPPYYPKADRVRPAAHNDARRGRAVGFRDSYEGDVGHPAFIGNPGGQEAIRIYREQMTEVYAHLTTVCQRMIVVVKNWTRLGVELRLDLDTILMAQSVGWTCTQRHGWCPPPSLWARFNASRGGGVLFEDILFFERVPGAGVWGEPSPPSPTQIRLTWQPDGDA